MADIKINKNDVVNESVNISVSKARASMWIQLLWARIKYVFYLSNYVFTNSSTILWLSIHDIMLLNKESKCGRYPHPASGINIDLLAIIIVPTEW